MDLHNNSKSTVEKESRVVTVLCQTFAVLLLLYPKDYRQSVGQEMRFVFQDAVEDVYAERGINGLLRLCVRTLPDLGKTAILEHLELSRSGRQIKRLLDLTFTFPTLGSALPVGLLIALLIRLESPGPVLYRKYYIGKGGKRFAMYKFRTSIMANSTEFDRNPVTSNVYASTNTDDSRDPTITSVGRFLRKTSLEQLPQIINVIRGEMSLVGPRPVSASEFDLASYDRTVQQEVLPGVTGLWQVSRGKRIDHEEMSRLDRIYVRRHSVWLDLKILLQTILIPFQERDDQ